MTKKDKIDLLIAMFFCLLGICLVTYFGERIDLFLGGES